MIALNGVSLGYAQNLKVLDQVSLQIEKGDFLYVLGGTGAGKTSLLRLLSTEEAPQSGSVSLFGYSLRDVSSRTLRDLRRVVGYIPQRFDLLSDLTVLENIQLAIDVLDLGKTQRMQAILSAKDMLDSFGLSARVHVLAGNLSGGEAQRVAIVRALSRNPKLILADEPTGAQDREQTWSIMEMFVKANLRGSTVLLATHDRDIVRRVRKRCAVLKNGHITVGEGLCIY